MTTEPKYFVINEIERLYKYHTKMDPDFGNSADRFTDPIA